DRPHGFFAEAAVRDAGLVGHDEEAVVEPRQQAQGGAGAAHQADPARLHVVGQVVDQSAVLVEEDRFHGQEVSRSGRTVSSATTVVGGSTSTEWMASATSAGSCRLSASRSGKRSSRKGVRMPPAITAV